MVIERVTVGKSGEVLQALVELLRDAVDGGASIGFLPPVTVEQALSFWHQVLKEVSAGRRVLLVAREGDEIVGSVQLLLAEQRNGAHRAEVQKLFVDRNHRRKGIGQALMTAIESEALKERRNLLVLDTKVGDAAETLYERSGYQRVGTIPRYAKQADGSLGDTAIFYRWVE